MILTCPNCSTRYSVNAKAFGESGRAVRCAQCGHKWHAMAQDEDEITLEEPITGCFGKDLDKDQMKEAAREPLAPEQADAEKEENSESPDTPKAPHANWREREAQRKRQKRRRIAFGVWGVILLILVLLSSIGIVYRSAVVRFWPNTASLYEALGMKVNLWGVDLGKTSVQRLIVGDANVLRISGEVTNPGKKDQHVPLVQISLRDETGATLYQWTVTPGPANLAPGEVAVFKTEVSNPPNNAVGIDFNFIDNTANKKPLDVPHAPPTEETAPAPEGHRQDLNGHE